MKLLSVNVSLPRNVTYKGRTVRTGIYKEPVEGRVKVARLNLEGDGQADLVGHGGEFRAVLVYSIENYEYWSETLGRTDLAFGQFGENFTVSGMLDDIIHVGDRFCIGTALFEVTQPRVPCYKLAMKMEVEGFYNRLLKSGRPGFYCRVLEEGAVEAGDRIEQVAADSVAMTVQRVSNLLYFDKDDFGGAREALRIPALSPGWRHSFEERLAKAEVVTRAREPYRTLVVTDTVPESEDITSFYLKAADGESLSPFLPGQFLPLKLDIPGQYRAVYRTYSLSDSPKKDYYRLTIKREAAPVDQPDAYPGVSSNYFHDMVEIGSELRAKSPRGKFFLDPAGESPVVLLSAGVGLTPLVSMLNAIMETASDRPVWFIHGSRNGRVHAMGDHVRRLASQHSNVYVHIRYSQPLPDDVPGRDYDDRGHVDIDLVERLVRQTHRDFYLCGPTAFMKSLFDGLLAWGVGAHRIHYEFFGPASDMKKRERLATPKRLAEVSACCSEALVTFSRSRVAANWNPSLESLLDLAEVSGLSPDYSCRSGVCHTCKCELTEGEVEYGLEPLDPPEEGSVLICCARPLTDITVDI